MTTRHWLLLIGCLVLVTSLGRRYEWGTVVDARVNHPTLTCGGGSVVSIQLESGGVLYRCMPIGERGEIPVDTRIRVCVAGSCQGISPVARSSP